MEVVVDGIFTFFFFFSSRRRHTIFKCDWSSSVVFFFFKQKTAYEIQVRLEFRRVLFRSPDSLGQAVHCDHLRPTRKLEGRPHLGGCRLRWGPAARFLRKEQWRHCPGAGFREAVTDSPQRRALSARLTVPYATLRVFDAMVQEIDGTPRRTAGLASSALCVP